MKSRNVETEAQELVYTSVDDALSGAWDCSIAVRKRAIQIEEKQECPRVALIRSLRAAQERATYSAREQLILRELGT